MQFPGDKRILEASDIAAAYRNGDVVELESGQQAVPVLLVISEHRGKHYDDREFPQILHLTNGASYNSHALEPIPAHHAIAASREHEEALLALAEEDAAAEEADRELAEEVKESEEEDPEENA